MQNIWCHLPNIFTLADQSPSRQSQLSASERWPCPSSPRSPRSSPSPSTPSPAAESSSSQSSPCPCIMDILMIATCRRSSLSRLSRGDSWLTFSLAAAFRFFISFYLLKRSRSSFVVALIFLIFLASQDALEVMLVSQWVSESVSDTVEPTWMMWPWWVKIPDEDFTGINPSIFATPPLTVPTSVYLQCQRPLFCWQSRRHFELVNLTWHRFTFFDQKLFQVAVFWYLKSNIRKMRCKKCGTLHDFACHPCAGAMLIFSVSFQF